MIDVASLRDAILTPRQRSTTELRIAAAGLPFSFFDYYVDAPAWQDTIDPWVVVERMALACVLSGHLAHDSVPPALLDDYYHQHVATALHDTYDVDACLTALLHIRALEATMVTLCAIAIWHPRTGGDAVRLLRMRRARQMLRDLLALEPATYRDWQAHATVLHGVACAISGGGLSNGSATMMPRVHGSAGTDGGQQGDHGSTR